MNRKPYTWVFYGMLKATLGSNSAATFACALVLLAVQRIVIMIL